MRARAVRHVLGLLAVFALAASAQERPPAGHAAAQARVAAIVRTVKGIAVPGATVRLVQLSSGRTWVSWTDDAGKFELPGLPAGHYRVEAEQLGFEPASKEFELTAAAAPPVELALRIAPIASTSAQAVSQSATAPAREPAPPPGTRENPPAAPSATAATKPETKPSPPNSSGARRTAQQAPANVAEMMRQRMRQGGFQQVDTTGQQGLAGQEMTTAPDAGPLGEASSSDAFLISGTVGRGATGGAEGGFGPFGGFAPLGGFGGPGGFPGAGEGSGFPGQPSGGGQFDTQMIGRPGPQPPQADRGRGQGQQQRQGQAGQRAGQDAGRGGGQRGGFGEGTEGLWGAQRILRQQVNRIRVGFHGRYGNSALDARPYSLTEANPAKIASWRSRFGVNVGGPLRLPRIYDGREKTFFFVNYDLNRSRDPVDTFATVPLPEERRGDFTARGLELFDPLSNIGGPRTPFGSSLPSTRLDPAAVALLRFIPPPNLPGLVQNFHLQTRVPAATDRLNVRVVHTISPKLNAQATYNLNETRSQAVPNFPELRGRTGVRGQNVMLGLTQNWTPRFIHDTRVMWNRNRTETLNRFAFSENIAAAAGITGVSTAPVNFGVPLLGLTNFTDVNDPVSALRRNQTLRFLDNISYALTKHTFRVGMEIRRMQINTRTDPTPRGAFNFTGLMTSQLDSDGRPVPGTGFDFADFLLGFPQSTTARFGTSSTYFRSWGFVGYFQDDWRMHPRFSFNWGLRYELVTPPTELFDHIANLDMNADITDVATVLPGQTAPFSGPLPRSLVRGDYNNWSPRIGVAWKPALKGRAAQHPITLRAGYSLFHNTSIYNQLAASMANQPPFAQAQTRLTSATQVLTLQNGFPPVPPTTVPNTVAVDPNYRVGYAQIWNASIETQLAPSTVLELAYTGTKGTHLDLLRAPNRAPSGSPLDTEARRRIGNALGFTYDTFGASSIYHALQVRVQRRMTRGLMIQGNYTFGKSIDNASSIGGGAPVVVQDDTNFRLERSISSFDLRHQFRSFYMYELPFGERKRWARTGWKAAALGHWQISGNTTVATGTPFTARVLGSAADSGGTGAGLSVRANQVGNPSLPRDQRSPLHFFDTAAFAVPPAGRFGNAARNTIPGPGNVTFNFSVGRWMSFGKDRQRRLDLRWEVSNLANTPNFTGLSTVANSATYGRVVGTRQMRTMDFQMRLNF